MVFTYNPHKHLPPNDALSVCDKYATRFRHRFFSCQLVFYNNILIIDCQYFSFTYFPITFAPTICSFNFFSNGNLHIYDCHIMQYIKNFRHSLHIFHMLLFPCRNLSLTQRGCTNPPACLHPAMPAISCKSNRQIISQHIKHDKRLVSALSKLQSHGHLAFLVCRRFRIPNRFLPAYPQRHSKVQHYFLR